MAATLTVPAPGALPAVVMTPSRVRAAVAIVGPVLLALAVSGALVEGPTGSVLYATSLGASAVVVLAMAQQHPVAERGWRLIGTGMAVWAATGTLVTIKYDANFDNIPDLAVYLGYTLGYVPLLAGFADLARSRLRERKWSAVIDGVLLFMTLYGVAWLLVVEQVAFDTSLNNADRAFQSLYPAADLALVLLSVAVLVSGTVRRGVAVTMVAGAVLSLAADVSLLALYLANPDGTEVTPDLAYLVGLALFSIAGVCALVPPAPTTAMHRPRRGRLSAAIAGSTLVPVAMLVVLTLEDENDVALLPVAIWVLVLVVSLVVRNLTGVRDLERAHKESTWLAEHDLETGTMLRNAFLRAVAEGSLRERSGTVVVVEIRGVDDLIDSIDASTADQTIDVITARLRNAMGSAAMLARVSHARLAAFLRTSDLGRGREIARALEKMLPEPVEVGDVVVEPIVFVGVAQADGVVIDVSTALRRATAAMRQAQFEGSSKAVFDADLMGDAESALLSASANGTGGHVALAAASPTTGH